MQKEPELKPAEKIAACVAALWPILFVAALSALTGCMRSITITRHADLPATNGVEAVSGGWRLDYLALGLKTDVSSIKAIRDPQGSITVEIDGVATDVSARHAEIIESAGTAAGNAAKAAASLK